MSRETFHLEKRAVYAYRNFPFGYATGCTIVRALTSMTRFSHSAFNLSLPTEIVHIFRQFHTPPPPPPPPQKKMLSLKIFFSRGKTFLEFSPCLIGVSSSPFVRGKKNGKPRDYSLLSLQSGYRPLDFRHQEA